MPTIPSNNDPILGPSIKATETQAVVREYGEFISEAFSTLVKNTTNNGPRSEEEVDKAVNNFKLTVARVRRAYMLALPIVQGIESEQ